MFLNNYYHFSAGASSGDGVSQPGILWTLQGDSVQINCTHNKGADYNQMYWYQQRKGESLSLIVFTKAMGLQNLEILIKVNLKQFNLDHLL